MSDDNLEYAQPKSTLANAKRRVSVTEPSTPTASRPCCLPESELSETESQSSVLSDARSPIKKSRSFTPRHESLSNSLESFHEPRGRRLRRPRAVRKVSASSTSSYDGKPEPVARRMRKSASCHSKGKESRREWQHTDRVGDTCKYLLDVLQSRSSGADRGTKSLPRNHKPHSAISRHINDALRIEKDCLKILKSVSKDKGAVTDEARSPRPAYSRRCDSEESYFEGFSSLPKRTNKARYPRTAEIKRLTPIAAATAKPRSDPHPARFQTIERLEAKKREKKLADECVLRIEDGNLWIEICKAVQESEARERKSRHCFQDHRL